STVSTTITKAEGGNFENLVTNPAPAETSVTDSIDNTTVTLTADKATVVEGGDITYTATLNNKAQTDVTVTLSNGQTITIKANELSGNTVFHTPA
ncbi:immunoglobulin-like domain-containing protein, partial [Pseudomonas syringae group genomosp. 3]|uniref:immunoglobulin-like domain-containing protein n=1 Tax=Pseudomonas syringae group genomosp. 3 TaxID=251701 RepID=UPI0001E27B73